MQNLVVVLITLNAKFGSNIDLKKVDFLSQEKISNRSRILTNVNNEDIFNKISLLDVFVYKAGVFTYFFIY